MIHSATHKSPVRTWNAATKRPCGFKIFVSDLPADNPQQSEEASHIGHSGNCKCRECMAGGKAGFKATESGYHEFYEVCDSIERLSGRFRLMFPSARSSAKCKGHQGKHFRADTHLKLRGGITCH